jgi:hypothetical protein
MLLIVWTAIKVPVRRLCAWAMNSDLEYLAGLPKCVHLLTCTAGYPEPAPFVGSLPIVFAATNSSVELDMTSWEADVGHMQISTLHRVHWCQCTTSDCCCSSVFLLGRLMFRNIELVSQILLCQLFLHTYLPILGKKKS